MEKIIKKRNIKNEGIVVFNIKLVEREKNYFILSDNFKTTFQKPVGIDLSWAIIKYKEEIKDAENLIRLSKANYIKLELILSKKQTEQLNFCIDQLGINHAKLTKVETIAIFKDIVKDAIEIKYLKELDYLNQAEDHHNVQLTKRIK